MKRNELLETLVEHDVPVGQWGSGEASTVEKLLEQINDQEIELFVDEDGELVRQSVGAGVVVLYRNPEGTLLRLVEWQEFADGRKRRRVFPGSIGEKLKPGEEPEQAALRAMTEELGITAARLTPYKKLRQDRPSQSFPGLRSRGLTHLYLTYLSDEQYKPEYVEKQDVKTNHFDWVEVRDAETFDLPFDGMTEVDE